MHVEEKMRKEVERVKDLETSTIVKMKLLKDIFDKYDENKR